MIHHRTSHVTTLHTAHRVAHSIICVVCFAGVQNSGPPKKPFSQGIEVVIRASKSGNLIVGAGDGTVALLEKTTFKVMK